VEQLSLRLVKKGINVTVICRSHYTPKLKYYNGIKLIRFPTINQKHLEMIVHTFISCLYLLAKKCDLVHIHSVEPALLAPIIKLRHRIVATSHGQAYRRDKWGKFAKAMSKLAEKIYIRFPNYITAVSKTLSEIYYNEYGKAPFYIPNGIEFRFCENSELLKRFGIRRDKYILYVGRLIPTKGPKILIDAYKKISTNVKLVLVGGSSHTDKYEEDLKKEASENIFFLGYQHGKVLNALYDHCKIFVFPSQIEGLPLVLLEALVAKKPLIFSDIPENMEIADGLGISFKNGDVNDLAEKLSYALSNIDIFESYKDKIEEKIRSEFNWDFIVDQYIKIYHEVMYQES